MYVKCFADDDDLCLKIDFTLQHEVPNAIDVIFILEALFKTLKKFLLYPAKPRKS